jgi:hypothetical protein
MEEIMLLESEEWAMLSRKTDQYKSSPDVYFLSYQMEFMFWKEV